MEIKEVLKNGKATPESLIEDLKNQIAAAQREIAAEDKLPEMRTKFIEATMNYVMALGLIDEPTDEDKKEVEAALVRAEKDIHIKRDGDTITAELRTPFDDDMVIRNFIRTFF